MFGTGWLTLRQARSALQNGRLDEALQLLGQPAVAGRRGTWELHRKIATAYAARGEKQLRLDNAPAAWADLLVAEGLQPTDPRAAELRQSLMRLGIAGVRGALEAGEPARAAQAIAGLLDKGVPASELQGLEDTAKDWLLTLELAERGEFGLAEQMLARVVRALPLGVGVQRFRDELQARASKFAAALPLLHEAVDARQWRDALVFAEQVLAAAPQHAEARKARAKAWQSPATVALPATPTPPAEPGSIGKRFHLWIDGVGGYLVCLGNRVTLGQSAADASADVPLLADISRIHATLSRDSEGYLLEANRPVQINGQPAARQLLQTGDRITLGLSCPIIFERPVAASSTARLDLGRGQRMPLSLDGVLLMAETLVLGPGGSPAHVRVEDLERVIVLYRSGDGLGLRCPGSFAIDGHPASERAVLPARASVTGPGFRFAVEPAGKRG